MKNQFKYLLIIFFISFATKGNGQACECTDCPIPIIDNMVTSSFLEVSGLSNPMLNVNGQGVCNIYIEFDHTWLTEVSITLIAPDGSSVDLVQDDPGGSTPNCTWNINFVSCTESAFPDPGYPDEFTSTTYANGSFTGTYYPGDGCFEDLTGNANGTWTLQMEDFAIADMGEVTTWSITFCEGTGAGCGPPETCEAEGGFYSTVTQTICVNGPGYITAPDVSGQNTSPDYGYTFTISEDIPGSPSVPGAILAYSENADFTGFSTGTYWVCGLSYLIADEALLPAPDGTLTTDDIQADIDNMLYCADLSPGCYPVNIEGVPPPPIITAPDTLCMQEIGVFNWLNYDPDAPYFWDIDTDGLELLDWFIIDFPTSYGFSGNGETDTVNISLTHLSACGDVTTSLSVVIIPFFNPYIIGETLTCYGNNSGNTYEFAISGLDNIISYNWFINPTEDSFIIGSSTDSTVTVGFPDDPDQFSGEICLMYEHMCGTVTEICLDITPNDLIVDNDFTPDTFCGLSGDFNIEASGPGTGMWMQVSGPGTSIFDDENELNTTVTVSETGLYTYTFSTECGDAHTVIIEFFESSGEPIIEGLFTACPGEILMFSVVDLEPNVVIGWNTIGAATIQGASDQSTVDVLLDNPGNGVETSVCFEYQDPCGGINTICEVIEFIVVNLVDLSDESFCNSDFSLNVEVNGMEGVGQWTLISGPGTPVFDNELSSVTMVAVDAIGDYVFEFSEETCGTSIQVPISIYEALGFDNLLVDCVGEDFIISFDLSGGLEPYMVDGVDIPGIGFTSGLLSGNSYSFLASDNSSCDDLEISGAANCQCDSDAGSISPQELQVSCNNENVSVISNGDAFFEIDDGATFMLYTELLDPLGSIAYESVVGDFSFIPPLQYGVVYYVAYVVGNELGGSVDYTDPCLDLATGASIIFYEPIELIGIESAEIIGCDIVLELTALQSTNDEGVWSTVSAPPGSTINFDSGSGIFTTATFSDSGTYVIQYSIDNGFCFDSIQVTLNLVASSGLSIVNISYLCDETNENYQVSFEIQGGESPYSVDGTILANNAFTSGSIASGSLGIFSIMDANDCAPIIFTSDYTCVDNCISYAEMLLTDRIELCAEESYTASESGNSVLDGDDIGVYILHTNAGNVLGTILDQNTNGAFSYSPALSYGVVYYISYVVGNEIAGIIDLSDECLSVAPGQSIIFYEEGIVFPGSYMELCSFEFDLTAEIIIGETGEWMLLSGPPGFNIQNTDTSLLYPSFLVDRAGEYAFTFTLYNGSCSNVDTIFVEVDGENSIAIMDDFSTCESSFDLFSVTAGSPKEWMVLGTSNFTIADAGLDSTMITFDTAGVFEIVRNVGSDFCAISDTLIVEIFEESNFSILDFICNEDKTAYSVSYTLEGNAYPYDINGQLINEGESIDLIATSGDTLFINVIDGNLCEVFWDTIIYSCACESVIGTLSADLIEACEDETIVVPPSDGTILTGSDSMVYVLHTSPIAEITDVLYVSSNGTDFDFDQSVMSLNTIYYVSLVIFNGDVFNINVLDDICTKVTIGTPVLWVSKNLIDLPGLQTFCEGETVEFSILYSGTLPISIKLYDDFGNEYEFDIIQEGESNFIIDVEESTDFILDSFVPLACPLDVNGSLRVEFKAPPFVQFSTNVTRCNSSANGSTLLLEELIVTSNSSGTWYDPDNNIVSGIIDFDGFTEGSYVYQFETSGNEPCDEVLYQVPILVEDCDCPMDIFLPFAGLCQGEYEIDLNDYLKPEFVDLGNWDILTTEGTNGIQIIGSKLFIYNINIGAYQVVFTFDTPLQDCPAEYTFDFVIEGRLSSGMGPLVPIEICIGDLEKIVLFDYLNDFDAGGEWASQNGLSINALTGLIDLTMADGGLYTFDYIIQETAYCPSSATQLTMLIHEPLELFLSILDPLCFGQNDGSVFVEDAEGTPVEFELFDSNQVLISDPDNLFSGDYELKVFDENGCIIIENFTLLNPLELFLNLGEDRVVEEGEITTITPVYNISGENISLYEWFVDQASFDAPTFDTLLLSPSGETKVQLVITDDDGCIIADDLLLSVIKRQSDVILANVFNPQSNTFGVEPFAEIAIVKRFSIYDRWGSLIFDAEDFSPNKLDKRWDGTFNGAIVNNGVYVFSLLYTNQEGVNISIFGDVAVIR